jgi:glycosyltransferase involved in cell wall biosynthesis
MFGYWLNLVTRVPYIVESFEPHAAYMSESGIWSKYGLACIIESYYEKMAKKTATALVVVSYNYYKQLVEIEHISSKKVYLAPCAVQLDIFHPCMAQRRSKRAELAIMETERVGIYVGKFGGIYYDAEAFNLFKRAYDFFKGEFRLLILTPTPIFIIESRLESVQFPLDRVLITYASHHEVPNYLAAADFAFSPIKPTASRRFCSPIKDGEYWAMGLPILITEGVGDDSDIIRDGSVGGAIFDICRPLSIFAALTEILKQLQAPECGQQVRKLAISYRNFDIQKRVYSEIFSSLFGNNKELPTLPGSVAWK